MTDICDRTTCAIVYLKDWVLEWKISICFISYLKTQKLFHAFIWIFSVILWVRWRKGRNDKSEVYLMLCQDLRFEVELETHIPTVLPKRPYPHITLLNAVLLNGSKSFTFFLCNQQRDKMKAVEKYALNGRICQTDSYCLWG